MRARHVDQTSVIVRYDPLPGEPDVVPIEAALTDYRFALTRTPEAGRDLSVHPTHSELELHRFGYRQPVAGSSIVDDADIGIVLVPGLAFDRWGNRLGFGAGYYDRFLGRLGEAVRMGVCDEVSRRPLPREPHDVLMTHLATPDGVIEVRSTTASETN